MELLIPGIIKVASKNLFEESAGAIELRICVCVR